METNGRTETRASSRVNLSSEGWYTLDSRGCVSVVVVGESERDVSQGPCPCLQKRERHSLDFSRKLAGAWVLEDVIVGRLEGGLSPHEYTLSRIHSPPDIFSHEYTPPWDMGRSLNLSQQVTQLTAATHTYIMYYTNTVKCTTNSKSTNDSQTLHVLPPWNPLPGRVSLGVDKT